MKSKSLLFTGITLLLIGILLRKLFLINTLGLILIITGVICKTVYIVGKYRSGEYKPGMELLILVVGLALFFTGLYLKTIPTPAIKPVYLLVAGISLKVVFIVRFIQKVKRTNSATS